LVILKNIKTFDKEKQMISFFKQKFKKIYNQVTSKLSEIFSSKKIDQETLTQLEKILLSADTGVQTTKEIINQLKDDFKSGKISDGQGLKQDLEEKLLSILQTDNKKEAGQIYLLVGVNGSGKTTFAAKLANKFAKQGKKVLLAAADTFRAAATEQLQTWAEKCKLECISGQQGQDPGSVVFNACDTFEKERFDVLIIDTAGRLQTKTNLMKELEKIKKIITKKLPDKKITTLLTIDAMLGQNSLEQAKIFNESTAVDGIILTKMDGTGKGGIIFALKKELNLDVDYVSFGERLDDFQVFDEQKYVSELF
jgi:fused signal recognition particle receptor